MTQRIEIFERKKDSKNWTLFFSMWLKELNFFSVWLKELSLFWKLLEELNPLFEYVSMIWTTLFLRMTQRLELCLEYDSMDWTFFQFDSKELNPFCHSKELNLLLFHDAKKIEPIFWNVTQRIEPDFQKFAQRIEHSSLGDWKNWVLFSEWLKDFVEYDSKNRTFLWIWLKVLNLFFNMTQGIESSFSEWLEDLNFILHMSQRIKPFLEKKKMTRRIDLLKNINQIIENFLMTQRIELLLQRPWLTELNLFSYDSQNWTLLFNMTQRIEPFLKNMSHQIFFAKNIQRIEHFLIWLKELNLLFDMTPRTELFLLEELNPFFFFFQIWIKELIFSKISLQIIDLFFFFWIWLTELNSSYKTQRLENFFTLVKEQ